MSQVFIDNVAVANGPFQFDFDGTTCVNIQIPADGMNHNFSVIDLGDSNCSIDTSIFILDCEDECFGFEAATDTVHPP